jgi:glutaredoxin
MSELDGKVLGNGNFSLMKAKARKVEIYSREGCHLCEEAKALLISVSEEIDYYLEEIMIDNDPKLIEEYGLMVPVILIDGKIHGFGRIERERFISALKSS